MVTAQRDTIFRLLSAGAGAAPIPESMAIVAEQLGATVARPEQTAVRELALVHRAGPLSPAATRFTELPIPVGARPETSWVLRNRCRARRRHPSACGCSRSTAQPIAPTAVIDHVVLPVDGPRRSSDGQELQVAPPRLSE